MLFDDPNDKLITSAELAKMIPGTTSGSWAARRHAGTGPSHFRLGARVYYKMSEVREWVANGYVPNDANDGGQRDHQ